MFYVRAEYPLTGRRIRKAIADAEAAGLPSEDIPGSGFKFNAGINEGAAAFVCGEETALMASAEGKRGMPSPKPPFPAVSGLYGKPTIMNIVDTLGNLPAILSHGAAWFRTRGTAKQVCPLQRLR
jgi:NADH:ubiquinone oxidoreductase subunit F (NADH-binding)